jgi:hypothetical protein
MVGQAAAAAVAQSMVVVAGSGCGMVLLQMILHSGNGLRA